MKMNAEAKVLADKIAEHQQWEEKFRIEQERCRGAERPSAAFNEADDRLVDLKHEIDDALVEVGIMAWDENSFLCPSWTAETPEQVQDQVNALGLPSVDAMVVSNYLTNLWNKSLEASQHGPGLLELAFMEEAKDNMISAAIDDWAERSAAQGDQQQPDRNLCTVLEGDYPGAKLTVTLRNGNGVLATYIVTDDGPLSYVESKRGEAA
jgi:hypothetical protein